MFKGDFFVTDLDFGRIQLYVEVFYFFIFCGMKNFLSLVAILWLWTVILTGCNSKNVWDVDYDLSTEIGREMHCYAQFQKNVKADVYWAEWVPEYDYEWTFIVEWKVKADTDEYNLVCNYSGDESKWTINYTPVGSVEVGNPASEYCVNQWWTFEIVSSDTSIYGECTLPDGTKCEEWAFYNGECQSWNDESQTLEFDLETPEGRQVACEERAGSYLNFNEWTFTWEDESQGWTSFVRNGHVDYLRQGEKVEDEVECFIDMVDKSVNVDFLNYEYNGELQEIPEAVEW